MILKYKLLDRVRFVYDYTDMYGNVIYAFSTPTDTIAYGVAIDPNNVLMKKLSTIRDIKKVDSQFLKKIYDRYSGYWILEIIEEDIMGAYWRPTASWWDDWIIKDEEEEKPNGI